MELFIDNIEGWKENLFLALNDLNKGCDTTKNLLGYLCGIKGTVIATWTKQCCIYQWGISYIKKELQTALQ